MKIRGPVKISFGYNKNRGVSKGWVDRYYVGSLGHGFGV
jgi:hypothetical protein